MFKKVIPVALLGATIAAGAYLPEGFSLNTGHSASLPAPQPVDNPVTVPAQTNRIEVVFALDTTGSMSGLIQTAKDKIWSIANTMASAEPAPEIAIGLVAYRDRGDDYVTKVFDLNTDLDAIYAQLIDFKAGGGGDGPESVNKALDDALHEISWSAGKDSYQAIFLVGDAPAHMDYQNERQFPELAKLAAKRGIVINTIRCGNAQNTQEQWQLIAAATNGSFFSVDQNGGALAIATPFDARLAELSADLDATRLGYGSAEDRERQALKSEATRKLHAEAPVAALARRGAFNVSASGDSNLYDSKDLVADVASGKVKLDELREDVLPETLRAMAPGERKAVLEKTDAARLAIRQEMLEVSKERDAYLADQAAAAPEAEASLDYQLFDAIKSQAEKKGLAYEEAAPKL